MNNNDFSPTGITNGSYVPECHHPAFSVAILVTHRNRQKQLDIFMPYMHIFLRKQNIHYKHAIADKFSCLILHDVDLLPLDFGNLYVCTQQLRHMSACIDKFRYVLPYYELAGGVLAMRADQYVMLWFQCTRSRYSMLVHPPVSHNAARYRILAENCLAVARGDAA
ncbi:Beta-1,4-galactosyltransferase, partial [Operophtera brumata]